MPFKSESQRKFMYAAEARGKIAKSVVDEFEKASGDKKLPKHLKASTHLAHRLAKKKEK